MAWQIDGADIVSAEGIAAFPEGRAVREALTAEVAFQCGYCAPGFTVALTALLRRRPDADESEMRTALGGKLYRCTGYSSNPARRSACAATSARRGVTMTEGAFILLLATVFVQHLVEGL